MLETIASRKANGREEEGYKNMRRNNQGKKRLLISSQTKYTLYQRCGYWTLNCKKTNGENLSQLNMYCIDGKTIQNAMCS